MTVSVERLEDAVALDSVWRDQREGFGQRRVRMHRSAIPFHDLGKAPTRDLLNVTPTLCGDIWLKLILENADPLRCGTWLHLSHADVKLPGAWAKGCSSVSRAILSVDLTGCNVDQIAALDAGSLRAGQPLPTHFDHGAVEEKVDLGARSRPRPQPGAESSCRVFGGWLCSQRVRDLRGTVEDSGDATQLSRPDLLLKASDETTQPLRCRLWRNANDSLERCVDRRCVLGLVHAHARDGYHEVIECLGEVIRRTLRRCATRGD